MVKETFFVVFSQCGMSEMPERNVRGGEFTEKRAEREEDTPFVGFFFSLYSSAFSKGENIVDF